MRIGHARSCCSGQNGYRFSRRLFSIFCFSLGFSIAFGVLGFEEPVEKKRDLDVLDETWTSMRPLYMNLERKKTYPKNNLTCLSSCIYILWLYRRCNYSAYNPRERWSGFQWPEQFWYASYLDNYNSTYDWDTIWSTQVICTLETEQPLKEVLIVRVILYTINKEEKGGIYTELRTIGIDFMNYVLELLGKVL